jgi:hypothetical protein
VAACHGGLGVGPLHPAGAVPARNLDFGGGCSLPAECDPGVYRRKRTPVGQAAKAPLEWLAGPVVPATETRGMNG